MSASGHGERVSPDIELPDLGSGDVYVYAYANGAVTVTDQGGGSEMVTLDVAIGVAADSAHDGFRVFAAHDDAPIAADAIERIGSADVQVIPFQTATGPMHWVHGTDALMQAAERKDDAQLVDLLTRGADVARRDESGSTVLHHAAGAGNRFAIDVLAAAGAELDVTNDLGFSPWVLATIRHERICADLLAELGADTSIGPRETITFRGGNLLYLHIFPLLAATMLVIVGVVIWPWGLIDGLVLFAIVVFYAVMVPPRAAWAGGSAHSLTGTMLTVRTVTRRLHRFDLRDVTLAATGGSVTADRGAGWLLLGHPDGHPVGRPRVFRRLDLPPADFEAARPAIQRVVVIPITAGRGDDVLRPIGNVLTACEVDLTPTLQQQLRGLRDWHRRWGRDAPRGFARFRERRRSNLT